MTPEANPYAAPQAETVPVLGGDRHEALAIRRAHLRHERALRSLGALWMFGGLIAMLVSASLLFEGRDVPVVVIAGAFLVGVGFTFSAHDVRQLNPRARVTGSILAALSLINIPIGTLIGVYALYLLHSDKGRVVLTEDYARICEQTPEVKHRTSIIVWIAVALLVGGIAIAVVAPLLMD